MIQTRKRRIGQALFIIFLSLFLLPGVSSAILTPPHDVSNGINCDSCHFTFSNLPLWWDDVPVDSDDVPENRVCWQAGCHDSGAMFKRTHSSNTTSTDYGEWTFACVVCHDPHVQRQTSHNEYLITGTVTGVDAGTRTFTLSISLPDRTGDSDPVDDYAGWTIVPHTPYKNINYKIASNTANTVTVASDIDTSRVSAGTSTFGILAGRYVRNVVYTPGGYKTVKYYKTEGENSFVDNDGLAGGQDSTVDGICQVCHGIRPEGAAIPYARADGTGFGLGHPTDTAENCVTCHTHVQGFAALCNGCHGDPPVDAGTLVFDPGPTGSATAGAHDRHANTEGIQCESCHSGSVGSGTTHNSGLNITLGFSLFGGTFQGGSYNGQSSASYNVTSTTPATTVTNTGTTGNGSLTCGTLYCHSDVQQAGGNAGPSVYATPSWDNTAPNNVVCDSCHGQAGEADGQPSTGAHAQHAASANWNFACSVCHSNGGSGNANHVNNTINLDIGSSYDNPAFGAASYTQGDHTPGSGGYGSCSSNACHGDASPVWSFAGIGCDSCHGGGGKDYPFDASSVVRNSDARGAHAEHIENTDGLMRGAGQGVRCSDCHSVPSAVSDAGHFDTADDADVPFPAGSAALLNSTTPSYTNGTQTCSVYCHGDNLPRWPATSKGSDSQPTWGQILAGCAICHGNPPANPHPNPAADCDSCHDHVNATNNGFDDPTLHINGLVEASGGTCDSCHGYPPAIGDGKAYMDGGVGESKGAHLKHVNHLAALAGVTLDASSDTFGGATFNETCAVCHNGASHETGNPDPANRTISVPATWLGFTYQFGTSPPQYNGTPGVSSTVDLKSCSNVSCHYRETPGWHDPADAGL